MFICTNCKRPSDREGHLPNKAEQAIGPARSQKVCVHCQAEFEESVRLFPGDFITEDDEEEAYY